MHLNRVPEHRHPVDLAASHDGRQWCSLVTQKERCRFSEIMRAMDDRYRGLSVEQLDLWMERRRVAGREPVLLGLKDSSGVIHQVIAFTERGSGNSPDVRRTVAMIGVATDVPGVSDEANEDVIVGWLAQVIRSVRVRFGGSVVMDAMRPRTMTFAPMQRMHDLMERGISVRIPEVPQAICRAEVERRRDRGETIFLRMTLAEDPYRS